ncbi:MAG: hypothetical protein IPP90_23700 [Gemmatimonadaceae bacterium]|nr:hypothetical protein [Gemmatimonadaceae bacterium]
MLKKRPIRVHDAAAVPRSRASRPQLTAEQKAAIRTINERFKEANKADLEALTANHA